jgi:hypothetical protein
VTPLTERWLYSVEVRHSKSRERRMVTVELTEAERIALLEYECFRPNHTGGPDGPIARSMAARHVERIMPAGFTFPRNPEIKRIAASNVRALRA